LRTGAYASSRGTDSPGPYGTFGQNGNVFEWNDTVISGWVRDLRGGSFYDNSDHMLASRRNLYGPVDQSFGHGFRISSVPEPSSLATSLTIVAGRALWWRRRKA
jgi:formylglycine-generating enzyme